MGSHCQWLSATGVGVEVGVTIGVGVLGGLVGMAVVATMAALVGVLVNNKGVGDKPCSVQLMARNSRLSKNINRCLLIIIKSKLFRLWSEEPLKLSLCNNLVRDSTLVWLLKYVEYYF
jgi:hypothetical protein